MDNSMVVGTRRPVELDTTRPDLRPAVNWHTIDWSKTDSVIAREIDYTRERVRQVRRGLGKPRAETFHQHGRTIEMRDWLKRNPVLARSLPAEELIRHSGVDISPLQVRKLLSESGIKPCVHDARATWRPLVLQIDWQLPNCDLAEIHGTDPVRIAMLRKRYHFAAAIWDGRSIHRLVGTAEHDRYRAAVEDERRRVAELRRAG